MISTLCMTDFATELERRIEEIGESPFSFARKLGHVGNGVVWRVLKGEGAVPLDDLDNWLDQLQVDGERRQRLEALAIEAYAPGYVKRYFQEMQTLRATVDELKEVITSLHLDGDDRPPGSGRKSR